MEHLLHGQRKWYEHTLSESNLMMKCCQKKCFRLCLIVAIDRSRSMHGREFHRRGRRLRYECLEALDVALECLSLRNVSWRMLDELKHTKLEIMK